MTDSTQAESKSGASGQAPKRSFGQAYWMCNSIEMFERLAYFGIRAVVPIYIMQATEPGGLHLTAMHKGWIYAWWAIFQSWLPMFTGGVADRYGYKRVLFFAITTNVAGYLIMAFTHDYYGFFAGILVLATGTAFFKPALQGTIAQNLTKENSSMGWGVFYWVVNVGAVCAPLLATVILGRPHSAEGWKNLFLASAAYTSVNLLLLLTFKDVPSGADKSLSLVKVFWQTVENIWFYWFRGGEFYPKRWVPGAIMCAAGLAVLIFMPFATLGWQQPVLGLALLCIGGWFILWLRGGKFTWQLRLPAFLLIMSCFWMMMYQLWDLHPNFIEDWIDSAGVAAVVPFETWQEYGDRGIIRVPQQILLNLNAFLIVLLVMPISYLVRKMRTLSAMLIGMSVATGGVLIAGLTGNGWILLLGIVFFSLGEMLTGPKKNQYLGLIAPKGKKGLYLGYVNIPIGIGVGIGSIVAGYVYGTFGEKASLALKHMGSNTQLIARAAQSADWSDTLELLPGLLDIDRSDALNIAAGELGLEREAAAQTLREAFRYDEGQITNLGLAYLAQNPELKQKATVGLARLLIDRHADAQAQATGRELSAGKVSIERVGVAQFVHLLPEAVGIKRPEVGEVVRDRVNRELPSERKMEDSAITDMLWDRFGDDRETLNNLALEFLAQGTNRVRDAVARMSFAEPTRDIEDRLGIGRTKAFAVLSAAMGADDAAVDAALGELDVSSDNPGDRAFVYLIEQTHYRFNAIARRDWNRDVGRLSRMIESDPDAMEVVLASVDPATETGGQAPLAESIAGKQRIIQSALSSKDWSKSPQQAASLLGLNIFEARALVAVDVNRSTVTATQLLWDEYKPQYRVWLPFAAVGVFATIALGIFGQMAKRWADMNA